MDAETRREAIKQARQLIKDSKKVVSGTKMLVTVDDLAVEFFIQGAPAFSLPNEDCIALLDALIELFPLDTAEPKE